MPAGKKYPAGTLQSLKKAIEYKPSKAGGSGTPTGRTKRGRPVMGVESLAPESKTNSHVGKTFKTGNPSQGETRGKKKVRSGGRQEKIDTMKKNLSKAKTKVERLREAKPKRGTKTKALDAVSKKFGARSTPKKQGAVSGRKKLMKDRAIAKKRAKKAVHSKATKKSMIGSKDVARQTNITRNPSGKRRNK